MRALGSVEDILLRKLSSFASYLGMKLVMNRAAHVR